MQVARAANEYSEPHEFSGISIPPPSKASDAATEWETLSLSELKDLLQDAIDEENYEQAAKIQEEMDRRKAQDSATR